MTPQYGEVALGFGIARIEAQNLQEGELGSGKIVAYLGSNEKALRSDCILAPPAM